MPCRMFTAASLASSHPPETSLEPDKCPGEGGGQNNPWLRTLHYNLKICDTARFQAGSHKLEPEMPGYSFVS